MHSNPTAAVASGHLQRHENAPVADLKKIETSPKTKRLRLFFTKVHVASTGCWEWTGRLNADGYASFHWSESGINTSAHRIAYLWFVGRIPAGFVVDHLCRNPKCVNPAHLEAVTQSENVLRGAGGQLRDVCRRGHPMVDGNIWMQTNYGAQFRTCLTCRRLREARRRNMRRALRASMGVNQ